MQKAIYTKIAFKMILCSESTLDLDTYKITSSKEEKVIKYRSCYNAYIVHICIRGSVCILHPGIKSGRKIWLSLVYGFRKENSEKIILQKGFKNSM